MSRSRNPASLQGLEPPGWPPSGRSAAGAWPGSSSVEIALANRVTGSVISRCLSGGGHRDFAVKVQFRPRSESLWLRDNHRGVGPDIGHRCRPDSRIRPSPIRAHRDMLRERRSVAELEEILAERLALLRPEPSARTSLSGSRRGKGTPPSDHDPRRRDTIEEGEGAGRALVAGFAADAAPPTPWACRPLRAGPRRGGAPLQPRQPEGQRPTKTS
jgi:hypothetical protein